MVRLHSVRDQSVATYFLRNRPELELLGLLLQHKTYGALLNIAVLGCSKGAEVYSLAWTIRSARPDLRLSIQALDCCKEILEFARNGVYVFENSESLPSLVTPSHGSETLQRNTSRDQDAWIFERITNAEIDAMFDRIQGTLSVKPNLRAGITWTCRDACDPELATALDPQDMVFANRFLCHMAPETATRCLRNIAGLVKPGGHLFVSGVDLEVRTLVALELGWQPVKKLLREIHEGDVSVRRGWPASYWGLEPLDSRRPDWQIRYASVFQLGGETLCEKLDAAS